MSDCPGRRDEVFLHAAAALEGAERSQLEAHLATGCPACSAALASAEASLAEIALGLPPVDPPPAVRERVVARVRATPVVAAGEPRTRLWAAAAGVALALGLGLGALLADRQLAEPLREQNAAQAAAEAEVLSRLAALEGERDELEEALAEQDDELARLEEAVERAGEQLAMFRGDEVVRVALRGSGALADVQARMYWEWKEEYTCYLHVRSLPAPEPGRARVLWLEDESGAFIRVGTLVREPGGVATIFAKLPREERVIVRVAVSEEADSGGPRVAPSGPVLLSAEL